MLESNDPRLEFVNYYGNTSNFALRILQTHGELKTMSLLSLGCLMPHFADYLAIFRAVYHVTMATTRLPFAVAQSPAKLVLLQQDFFTLQSLQVDCVISHAAIHCFNDSRYGNIHSPSGFQKPYQVPAKLREIVGDRRVPTIVSISVNRQDGFFDNNTHLSHDKFVAAFARAGFELKDYFFDYVCGGIPQKPEYLNVEYRRSKKLPEACESPRQWVVGNYYFL
jgi:hypothetical protein